jgi:class 3 adenylate cyclase
VHEFLSAYFQIYPKAVLELVYALEPKAESEISVQGEQVRNMIVPSMFKNLGDGMMLVWELQGGRAVHDAVTARILQILATIQRLFNHLVAAQARGAGPPYSTAVSSLRLGFGLARGHAWRLTFSRQRTMDYAGSIVNLAARLQDLARPEGIVAQVGFCDRVLRTSKGQRARVATLKGLENPVEVWASQSVHLDL